MQAQTPTEIPKVIIYRSQLLPLSETFIRQQALALRHWRPVLVGERRLDDGLDLDRLDVHLLRSCHSRLADFYYRLCRFARLPHRPTVRKLQKIGARLIHVHFGTDAVDVWPNIRALGLPMLVTLHGFDININRQWWEAGHAGWRRRRYPSQLLRLAHDPMIQFVAVSKAIRARAIEYGIPAEKIMVRYIGVDTDAFQPGPIPVSQRRKRILFVGRLIENKGVDILIRAYARVIQHIADVELVIVGDGPLRKDLEELAAELNVSITFMGALQNDDVKTQLHQCRLLCQPSRTIANGASEAFGIVLLEAQASGIPVISSSRGGSAEGIADGATGRRFDEGNFAALAAHIIDLIDNPAELLRISENARSFVQRTFDLTQRTYQLESDYSTFSDSNFR